MEEEMPLANQEEKKEKDENSLLNYECDEDNDGVDEVDPAKVHSL